MRKMALLAVVCVLAVSGVPAAERWGWWSGQFIPAGAGLSKKVDAKFAKADAEWTMSFWVRPDREIGDQTLLAGFGDIRTITSAAQRYWAVMDSSLQFWNGQTFTRTSVKLDANQWQLLCAVFDGKTLTLYKDGQPVGSESLALAQAESLANLAPCSPWPGGRHFAGRIARFSLVAGVQDAAAIKALLKQSEGLDKLKFEDGSPAYPYQVRGGDNHYPRPTPPDLMPKPADPAAADAAAKVLRKPPLPAAARLTPHDDGSWTLADGWRMAFAIPALASGETVSSPGLDVSKWYVATVPGTVLATLVDNGVYPDPYFGLNNLAIPESLCKQDYWYRIEFDAPPAAKNRRTRLVLNGVNYAAEAWLNGHKIGSVTGAFLRGQFDATEALKPADNVLAVRITPPPHPGLPHEESIKGGPGPNGGELCKDGPTFFASEGWDWVPTIRDRCMGLWQDVRLRVEGDVAIGDPHVVTRVRSPQQADVTVSVELHNGSKEAVKGTLTGQFEGAKFQKEITLPGGKGETISFTPEQFPDLSVKAPRLWWPNGYGKPELYHLELAFTAAGGEVSDARKLRFGIREISYELTALDSTGEARRVEFSPTAAGETPVIDHSHAATRKIAEGIYVPSLVKGAENSPALKALSDTTAAPFLVIKVNGQRIACKGGNWGMDDGMKRVSRARLEPYVRLHRDANCTMIRNWCGQNTEEELFDLCDEYGLLVWSDFWLSTQDYNYEPDDAGLFMRNVADTIRRFRNHPSIAIWCARNEGMPPKVINEGLDQAIRGLDGTRYYQPNSRLVSLLNSGPWDHRDPSQYFKPLAFGFDTELGMPSIPTLDALRQTMLPKDLWPVSDTWAYHDWHSRGGGDVKKFMADMNANWGKARDLEDFVRKAQMMHYTAHRAAFEGMNAYLWKPTGGRLLWMTQPAWPSTMWQILSWNYDTAGAYYGVQKACEPLHIQWNLIGDAVCVANSRLEPLAGANAVATIVSLAGKQLWSKNVLADVPANASVELFPLEWPAGADVCLLSLELLGGKGEVLSRNFYWRAAKPEDLQKLDSMPQVDLSISGKMLADKQGNIVAVEVENNTKLPALMAHLVLRDGEGLPLLPAYAGDNYISLLPGQKRTITIETTANPATITVTADGWNITPAKVTLKK